MIAKAVKCLFQGGPLDGKTIPLEETPRILARLYEDKHRQLRRAFYVLERDGKPYPIYRHWCDAEDAANTKIPGEPRRKETS